MRVNESIFFVLRRIKRKNIADGQVPLFMFKRNTYQCLFNESSEEESSSDDEEHGVECVLQVEGGPSPRPMVIPSKDVREIENAAMIQMYTISPPPDPLAADDEESKIEFEMGNELPVFPTLKVISYNRRFFSNPNFWGRCFLCGESGHSQAFCSLKYCPKCQEFGHSPANCTYSDKIEISTQTDHLWLKQPYPNVCREIKPTPLSAKGGHGDVSGTDGHLAKGVLHDEGERGGATGRFSPRGAGGGEED